MDAGRMLYGPCILHPRMRSLETLLYMSPDASMKLRTCRLFLEHHVREVSSPVLYVRTVLLLLVPETGRIVRMILSRLILRLPGARLTRGLSSRASAVLSSLDIPTSTELSGVYDGQWGGTGDILESVCPTTGEVLAHVKSVSLFVDAQILVV